MPSTQLRALLLCEVLCLRQSSAALLEKLIGLQYVVKQDPWQQTRSPARTSLLAVAHARTFSSQPEHLA